MRARLIVVGTGSDSRSHSSHRRSLVNKVSFAPYEHCPLQGLSKRMSVCPSLSTKSIAVQSLLGSWNKSSQARQSLCQFHLISILVQPSLDRFSKSVPSRKAQASPKLLVPMPMASGALQMSLHFAPISSVQKTVQGPGEKTGASTESTGQAEQLRL